MPVLVAAAADLQSAMPQIVAAFQAQSAATVTVSFGSTGNLARQLRQGAPFELFLAADESFITSLAADGVIDNGGSVYAEGRLSLIAGRQSRFATTLSLESIADAARAGLPFRIAIANTEHAPYGQRAAEVIKSRGLDDVLRSRLVFGENVAAALQLVASGAAAAGLVGSSLAKSSTVASAIVHVDIPADWHSPLLQRMALTKKASGGARELQAFILGEPGQAILRRHGFVAAKPLGG